MDTIWIVQRLWVFFTDTVWILFWARSELKKRNYFNFSSFFGDFCLKVFGKEVIAYLS
jgi:hypothetical protein